MHNILDFPKRFPARTVLKLEQNYRSVQPILDATNAVIALCPKRYNKDLFSTRASAAEAAARHASWTKTSSRDYVIKPILEHHEAGIALKKQAVLFRAAHHSDALEVELGRRNIPFVKYGGLKFLEAAHVKDVLSLPAPGREPARHDQRLPRAATARRRRPGARRSARSRTCAAHGSSTSKSLARLRPARAAAAAVAGVRRRCWLNARRPNRTCRCPSSRRGPRSSTRRSSRSATTRPRCAARDIEQLEQISANFRSPRGDADRPHARPAEQHAGSRRPAAAARRIT